MAGGNGREGEGRITGVGKEGKVGERRNGGEKRELGDSALVVGDRRPCQQHQSTEG